MNISVIVEYEGTGEAMSFYAHGHHEPEAFAAAVLTEYDATIQPAKVRHVWLRQIPAGPEGILIREYAQNNGRGSFAATVVDWGSL